jgi:hypothetical protein
MLIKSKIDGREWIWIRIPKTAGRAYSEIFNHDEGHSHLSYQQSIEKYGNVGRAFSVVRNPTDRLKSGIMHDIEDFEWNNPGVSFPDWMTDINSLCDLFFKAVDKNCIIKDEISYIKILKDASMMSEVLKTQCSAVHHPDVKIFKYENLQEFNEWIENTLGYDVKRITINGASNYQKYNWLDFSNPRFIELCKVLYKHDYDVYGY